MNEEQNKLLKNKAYIQAHEYDKNIKIKDLNESNIESLARQERYTAFKIGEDDIIINQSKGIEKLFLILSGSPIERFICNKQDGAQEEILNNISVDRTNKCCVTIFDFKNPITNIIGYFHYDMADPIELEVTTNLFDCEVDEQNQKQEKLKELTKKMNVSHSLGQNLINIKFKHCEDNVAQTRISLYSGTKQEHQLMAIFKVEKGQFFKAINNLAYGKYCYSVEQLDKSNNIIAKTDLFDFTLSAPNYTGKQIVGPGSR